MSAEATSIVQTSNNAGRELSFYGMDREQVDLIKRTVAKGANDDQLALFLVTAKRLGLDPFARQIYCVLRKNKSGGSDMAIQTGIDGLRSIAARTGEMDGMEGPWWAGEDGVWRETWTSKTPPAVARFLVYRKGASRSFPGVAHLASYGAYKDDGKTLDQKWAAMPENMLAKCAEAAALRRAFPLQMDGVYIPEEMERNAIDVPSVEKVVSATQPAESIDPWPAFLDELAKVPGAAELAEKIETPVSMWTEEEIVVAFQRMFDAATSVSALNTAVGPWFSVITEGAKSMTRLAKLKADLAVPYKNRTAALRQATAQKGPES